MTVAGPPAGFGASRDDHGRDVRGAEQILVPGTKGLEARGEHDMSDRLSAAELSLLLASFGTLVSSLGAFAFL